MTFAQRVDFGYEAVARSSHRTGRTEQVHKAAGRPQVDSRG